MQGEDQIIDALRAAFGTDALVVFGRNDPDDPAASQRYDLARGQEVFGNAKVLIGPHGAAFCNVMLTRHATMVLLPLCDSVGCPASQDTYFTYIAGALGVDLVIPDGPSGESVYRNYTVGDATEVDSIVDIVRTALAT